MDARSKADRVAKYLRHLTAPESVLSRFDSSTGQESASGVADSQVELTRSALQKLSRGEGLTPSEADSLEAIILPNERPVVFVRNGTYSIADELWGHFSIPETRQRLEGAISSIGRIDLPNSATIPFGGTGFVVGEGLLMTNRHVAELFTLGQGTRNLQFRPGEAAAIDFKREHRSDITLSIQVVRVLMIHPYWDMAILQVTGLPPAIRPLHLSVKHPDELFGQEVAVVGYPARDWRNDSAVQDRVFGGVYNVKRLQPGKIRDRKPCQSFGKSVSAMTHDASTLGGNSGSALIEATTGEVVGLHFAGVYLENNYAVPTFELARDTRVVDCGVNFHGSVAPTTAWASFWVAVDGGEEGRTSSNPLSGAVTLSPSATQQVATFTVPLQITVAIGQATVAAGIPNWSAAVSQPGVGSTATADIEKVPVIYPDIASRQGYQDDFLEFADGLQVPMPQLTDAGLALAAKLENGSPYLKYHRFTVVIHKKRRLALFTAANVDWRQSSRTISGRKPSRKELNGFIGNEREDWVTDPRIPFDHQLPDYFYVKDGGAFDRGHLVRRDDVAWGKTFEEMQRGNGDTFHTTNCSPQTAEFNQSSKAESNWGALENMIQKQTSAEKVCVISGPVLADDDRYFHGLVKNRTEVSVQIPKAFWKIIVAKSGGKPAAFGFILDQELSQVNLHDEFIVPDMWKPFLRPISEIESQLNELVDLTEFKPWDQFGS